MPRLLIFLTLAGAWAGQNQSNPPPRPPGPEQPGGVFRIPSRWPEEPKIEVRKEEPPAKAVLRFEGKPMLIPFACTEEDIAAFGMTCTGQDPCPVFADLAGLQPLGSKIFVVGNLHDGATTMYSLFLQSADEGKTWEEPFERIKGAGLDQIQFFDFETGWASGEILQALPRDPFFLLTTDGGKSWRRRPVYSEARAGAIDQFLFDSRTSGMLVVDRMQQASGGRFERYETQTGGDTWMIREVTQRRPLLKKPENTGNTDWRMRADARTGAHVIERRAGARWEAVASFVVKVGECKPDPADLKEPPPLEPPVSEPAPAAPRAPSRQPTLKKKP